MAQKATKERVISLEDEFNEFDASNPHVYELLKRFAFEAMSGGHHKFSVYVIFERIRWELAALSIDPTNSSGRFKLPNNHRPYYARKFKRDFPQHAHLFKTCRLRSVDDFAKDRWGEEYKEAA